MLVPRSYKHTQRRTSSTAKDEKSQIKANISRSPSPSPSRKSSIASITSREITPEAERPRTPPIAVPQRKPSAATPSIPSPMRTGLRGSATTQSVRIKGQHADRRSMPKNHRSDTLPPAVAALLAVTSIPPRPHHPSRRRSNPLSRKISIDELVEEWRKDDEKIPTFKTGSPMDVLLERPEDQDIDDLVLSDSVDEQEGRIMASRSISSDSLTSTPSLEVDDQSVSSWSTLNLETPQSFRKGKAVSSPPKEDCVLDHPLLHYSLDEATDIETTEVPEIITKTPKPNKPRSSFKSNLTASLQALKSAAKSFSNFTAPSIPPDDFLTRSILYPRFTSEMRPKPLEGLPGPALRRYLNPLSPTELSMQIEESESLTMDAPMIQLQTYDRRGRNKRGRRASLDPRSEAGRVLSSDPSVRQREPRENGDFLRIIVMEMNMRREGKLDAKAIGKARIWLPPRKMEASEISQHTTANRIPARWVGVALEDV